MSHQTEVLAKGNGRFAVQDNSFDMQIMNVKDFNSWNNNDYHPTDANYIAFVVSRDNVDEFSGFMKQIAELVNLPIVVEND